MSIYLKFDKYLIRQIEVDDTEQYYRYGFENMDEEVNYFTGTTSKFSKQLIIDYVKRIVNNNTRMDCIIIDQEEIIGEIVLSELDKDICSYRIALFSKKHFNKGIGKKASSMIFDYAFKELNIKQIELEVYPFNERGIHMYKKLGFIEMNRIMDEEAEERYKEIIVMRLDKNSFKPQ